MHYKVEVIERLTRLVDVEADSAEEAVDKAEHAVNAEEVVLGADDFCDRDFEVEGFGREPFGECMDYVR